MFDNPPSPSKWSFSIYKRYVVLFVALAVALGAGSTLDAQTLPAATQASGLALANAGVQVGPEVAPTTRPAAGPTTMTAAGPATLPAIEHEAIRPGAAADGVGKEKEVRPSDVPTGVSTVVQVAAAMGVVLAIIFVGRMLVRKYVPGVASGNGKGVLEVLARYPVGKSQSVVLLRIGSQIVALNQTKEASHSILVISEPEEVASILGQIQGTRPSSIQAGFSRELDDARKELETGGDKVEANRPMDIEDLDAELDEMAAAKRQLMELRAQVRSVRESLPVSRRMDV